MGKESVTLRQKALANGDISLYLDIYASGHRKSETLFLYLKSGTKPEIKAENANTLRVAKTIQAKRQLELANNKAGLFSETRGQMLFVDYVQKYHDAMPLGSAKRTVNIVLNHIKKYDANKHTKLVNLDKIYLVGLLSYIRANVCENTAFTYYSHLRHLIINAVKRQYIHENPFKYFLSEELPKQQQPERGFLTIEEIKQMEMNTQGINRVAVQTFLFSVFCGLRYSDITKLKWANLQNVEGRATIIITMQKTKQPLYLPLNEKALAYLPKRNEKDPESAPIFKRLSIQTTDRQIEKWAKQAGVNKKVSFHIARHTHATTLITKGADLYTISKLLGHKSIKTTQIYADIISAKKQGAVDLLNTL